MSNARRPGAALLVVLLAVAAAPIPAQDDATTLLGAGFTGRPYLLQDDLILETIDLYEIIRDYAEVTEPEIVGWYDHSSVGVWRDVLHEDGLLVALRDQVFPYGFSTTDVSDPTAPTFLGEVSGTEYSSGWLRDGVLLVSTPEYVVSYDLADPTVPVFTSFHLAGPHDTSRWFSAVGDALFFIDEGTTLRVFDVADPRLPGDLGTVDLAGDRIDAMIAGEGVIHLLMATAAGGGAVDLDLVTCDVSEPLAPVVTDRQLLVTAADPSGLTLHRTDELLLAGTADGRVLAFGLHDPTHPEPGWSLDHASNQLLVSATRIFVTTTDHVLIYPRTDHLTVPADPIERLRLPRLTGVMGEGPIQLTMNYDQRNLIAAVDVTNPRLPTVGPWFDMGQQGGFGEAGGLGLSYTAEGHGQLIDLTDPREPALLGTFEVTEHELYSMVMTSDVAVFGTEFFGRDNLVFDLSDPWHPDKKSRFDIGDPADIQGRLCVVRDAERFDLVDLTDLSEPQHLGGLAMGKQIRRPRLHGDHLYLLTESDDHVADLHVVDIQDPSAPQIVTTLPVGAHLWSMAFNDHRLYLIGFREARIYDITIPDDPVVVGSFPYPGHTGQGMAFHGDLMTFSGWLVTRRDNGFVPTDVPGGPALAACRLEPAHPNPFNPSTTIAFAVDHARELAISIHDVRGRRVAEVARGVFEPGRHAVTWHGQDQQGRALASGVYLVRLHGPGVEASQLVTLVK